MLPLHASPFPFSPGFLTQSIRFTALYWVSASQPSMSESSLNPTTWYITSHISSSSSRTSSRAQLQDLAQSSSRWAKYLLTDWLRSDESIEYRIQQAPAYAPPPKHLGGCENHLIFIRFKIWRKTDKNHNDDYIVRNLAWIILISLLTQS